jgi:hypothetical protein
MFKSFIASIVALLAATFGMHHAQTPTSAPTTQHSARYEITVVNDYFADPIKLTAGTRFKAGDGSIFRTDQPIMVPGKRDAANGTVTISVVADKARNNPSGRLSLPGLAASPAMYAHVYAVAATPAAQTASAAAAFNSSNNITEQFQDLSSTQQTSTVTSRFETSVRSAQRPTTTSMGTSNLQTMIRPTFISREEVGGIFNQIARVVSLLPQMSVTREFVDRQTIRTQDGVGETLENYLALSGGTLAGNLTVNGVAGLTDADIPNDITASNYLPLTGGTLLAPLGISSGGTGTSTWLTGSIPFFDGSRLTEDNGNLFWDGTNHRLGIGTSSPSVPLEIYGSNSSTNLVTGGGVLAALVNADQTNGNFDSLSYRMINSAGSEVTGTRISGVFNSHAAGTESADLAFLTRNAGTLAERMRLTAGGFLGIGTSSPVAQLTISSSLGLSAPFWGTNGIALSIPAGTYTDTSSSGSANAATITEFGIPTVTANSATTYNMVSTVRIEGAPIAGLNATITDPMALRVGGNTQFSGFNQFGSTSVTPPSSVVQIAGNQSASSWTTTGLAFAVINSQTYTDLSTAANSTITTRAVSSFMTPILGFSNATSTITNAATLYINGAPTAQASSTIITNPYALFSNSGNVKIQQGSLNISTSTSVSGIIRNLLTVNVSSGGQSGTATPDGITINDMGNASSWETTNPFAVLDFSSTDVSTVGAGVRARIGTVMQNAAGGLTRLGFFTAPATAGTMVENMTIAAAGNVGIASTTPWKTFSVAGTVAFAGLTTDTADAKTLCLTSANEVVANTGSTCITSSQRFKTNIAPLNATSGLAEVLTLRPVSFNYKPEIGVPGTQVGFIAEDMQQTDPRLVVFDAGGTPFTVRYENLTAILAKAIQEVAAITGAFRDHLIAWLGDAANGIHDLYAGIMHAHSVQTDELCVGDVCVTRDQFLRMTQGVAAGEGSASPSSSSSGSGSRVVTIGTEPPMMASTTDQTGTTQPATAPAPDSPETSAAPDTSAPESGSSTSEIIPN